MENEIEVVYSLKTQGGRTVHMSNLQLEKHKKENPDFNLTDYLKEKDKELAEIEDRMRSRAELRKQQ